MHEYWDYSESQWREATVVPLPKIVPTRSADNLRAVSLSSTLAKVNGVLCLFVDHAKDMAARLDPRQFGNRRGKSTPRYLVQMVQHLHQALQDGRSNWLLATDYSKVFDHACQYQRGDA